MGGAVQARPQNWPVVIAITAFVLGLMFTMQFRLQQEVASSLPYKRLEDATSVIKQAEDERNSLKEEVFQLRQKMARASEGVRALEGLQAEMEKAKMLAGLVELRGHGIRVLLNDSPRPRQSGGASNAFAIHDDDVLKIVNELAAAGAEAMAVNGQRLVGTSEIRDAGSGISINNTRTAPPIEILAIGDPGALEAALMMRGGIIETLTFWGLEVKIEKKDEVVIPAYKSSLRFRYAAPVPTEKEGGK